MYDIDTRTVAVSHIFDSSRLCWLFWRSHILEYDGTQSCDNGCWLFFPVYINISCVNWKYQAVHLQLVIHKVMSTNLWPFYYTFHCIKVSYGKYVQTVLLCKLVSTLNQYNRTAGLFSFISHKYTYTTADPLNGQTNTIISYGI